MTSFALPGNAYTPHITAGSDGALWFTNAVANVIERTTTTGELQTFPDFTINDPDGIATGPDGGMWFTNINTNSIGRVSTADSVTTAPTLGRPGTPVTITGQGFTAGEPVRVTTRTAVTLCRASAAGDGSFSCAGVIPSNSTPGSHTITANGQTSGTKVQAVFLVT